VEAHNRGAAEAVAELAAGSSPEGAERNVPAEATVEVRSGAGAGGWRRWRPWPPPQPLAPARSLNPG